MIPKIQSHVFRITYMRAIVTIVFLTLNLEKVLNAQVGKTGGEVAERLLAPAAKEVSESATKTMLKEAAAAVGREAADRALKTLAVRLTEAAKIYGEKVLVLARRVPEASEVLASRAQELLPLEERMGDDILRLEARAPGFGELAANFYGRGDVARLLKLPKREMESVIVLSTHATEPRSARLLLEGAEKGGQHFLEKISSKQIMVTGLSVGIVLAAYRLSGIVEKAPNELIDAGEKMGTRLLAPVSYAAAILFTIWGGLAIRLWNKRSKRTC